MQRGKQNMLGIDQDLVQDILLTNSEVVFCEPVFSSPVLLASLAVPKTQKARALGKFTLLSQQHEYHF